MALKTCNKCKCEKSIRSFYANKRMKDGLNTFCIECHKADNVARKALCRNDELFKQAERAYKTQYRQRTTEQRALYMKEWRSKNAEYTYQYAKQYRQDNKAFINFLSQNRKLAMMQRTPLWLGTEEMWMIEEAYQLAALRTKLFGFAWHVDHVIPLRGKKVSGLHTPQNLSVIPGVFNMQKTNKFEVEYA
jgi:hypothetical protein